MRRDDGTQAALDEVAMHSVPHRLGYDKADLWRVVAPRVLGEMDDHGRPASTHAAAHRPFEIYGTAQSVRRGEHAIRQRARCGPCDGGQPGWRGRHGSAYAAGSRGSSPGAGCSAGRSACSRGTPRTSGRYTVYVLDDAVTGSGGPCRCSGGADERFPSRRPSWCEQHVDRVRCAGPPRHDSIAARPELLTRARKEHLERLYDATLSDPLRSNQAPAAGGVGKPPPDRASSGLWPASSGRLRATSSTGP